MKIKELTNIGISGKTIELTIAELIVLSNTAASIDNHRTELVNALDNNKEVPNETIVELNDVLSKVYDFLSNVTKNVTSLDDAANEIFTHLAEHSEAP